MINLRFHIVSIVAIFLALAIGLLAGSTLLDKATVELLRASQRRLDATNEKLKDENSRLRSTSELREPATKAFGDETLDQLLPVLMNNEPTLIIATRGIHEDTVRALQASVLAAGGSPLGIVWFDERFDLDDENALTKIATALGVTGAADADKVRAAVLASITRGLAAASVSGTTTTTTTTAPGDLATVPENPAPAPTEDPSLGVLSTLADAELVDWESPVEGEPAARTLPPGRVDLVLLSGEGSTLAPRQFMYPLVRALAARTTGFEVGEVRTPRTDLEVVDDPNVPPRGAFVDPLRRDDRLAGRIITVDNVDEPFGRLAAVLALAGLPTVPSGEYGTADTAQLPFPPPPK